GTEREYAYLHRRVVRTAEVAESGHREQDRRRTRLHARVEARLNLRLQIAQHECAAECVLGAYRVGRELHLHLIDAVVLLECALRAAAVEIDRASVIALLGDLTDAVAADGSLGAELAENAEQRDGCNHESAHGSPVGG